MSAVTILLARARQGDPSAASELLPLIYEELRKLGLVVVSGESWHPDLSRLRRRLFVSRRAALSAESTLKLTAFIIRGPICGCN
jgi:hypothetical protein